jgi:chaperonin GroEL
MNKISSNILNEKDTKMIIGDTLKHLRDSLSNSLGPYGSTSVMQDKFSMNHQITKDGYTILNSIKYNNEVSSTILDIVKKISRNLVKEVGDGSTSSIIIANSLFETFSNVIENNNLPRKDLIDTLSAIQKDLEEIIKELAIPITEENFHKVKDIASISNNNDDKAGELIHEVYEKIGKDGFINLETSLTPEDRYVITKGMEVHRGSIDPIFANHKDKVTTEFQNAKILVSSQPLEETEMSMLMELLGECIAEGDQPLVILSRGFSAEIKNFLRINKNQKRDLNVCAVDYAILNAHHQETLEDIAIYLGGKVFDKYEEHGKKINLYGFLGECEKFISNDKSTKFIEGRGDEKEIQERIDYINEQIEALEGKDKYIDTSEDLFKFKKRIADFGNKVATVYVGGSTDIEKDTRKYLMEDAVFACQSALKYGYIGGGNLIIPRLLSNNPELFMGKLMDNEGLLRGKSEEERKRYFDIILMAVFEGFLDSYSAVLRNKYHHHDISEIIDETIKDNKIYNLKTSEFEDANESSVINSVITDIEIMKASFSIIGLLVTSNQFVSVQIQQD